MLQDFLIAGPVSILVKRQHTGNSSTYEGQFSKFLTLVMSDRPHIAVFTDISLAEQFMKDYSQDDSCKVATFHDPSSFLHFIEFAKSLGNTDVVFDPSLPGTRSPLCSIDDVISALMGKDSW